MAYDKKRDPDFVTDNGPACPQCGCHCYGYQPVAKTTLVNVRCWSCYRQSTFAHSTQVEPDDAVSYREQHHKEG